MTTLMNLKKIVAQNQRLVADWNSKHQPGTRVKFRDDNGLETETTTRSEAQMLGGHSAVIWLEGVSGAYKLDRVTPL